MSAHAPAPLAYQEELQALARRGFTVRLLGPDLVELRNEQPGNLRIKSLRAPDETDIRSWAAGRHIPILDIDPLLIDTLLYAGWYVPWSEFPVSNVDFGPLLLGDVDGNERAEAYGMHGTFANGRIYNRIFEMNKDGAVILRHDYGISENPSLLLTDIDNDSLTDVVFQRGDSMIVYEQDSPSTLPIVPRFTFVMWQYPGTAILTRVRMSHLNRNDRMDFLYRGSEIDSTRPSGFRVMTYISEYDPILQNFRRIWWRQLRPEGESGTGGYDVGDYDGDGHQEFLASGSYGQVWVYESKDSNDFEMSFSDSLPFVNQYYQTSGDVDHDGRREFFVGATMSNGNWTTMYEAEGNDQFSPRFMIHLLTGGALDEPTYLCQDVNSDGTPELVIASGNDLFIFRSTIDDQYFLHYYKNLVTKEAVQAFDVNKDGLKDLIVSRSRIDTLGRRKFYATAYLGTLLTHTGPDPPPPPEAQVEVESFPNPFNASTTISFSMTSRADVEGNIFSLLGQVVQELVHTNLPAGSHSMSWAPRNLGSGIYLLRLKVGKRFVYRKLVLLR